MTGRCTIAILTACAIAAPRPALCDARSDKLVSDAEAAFGALRYDDALRMLDEAWRRGASDPRQLRVIFSLAGRAAGVIGEADTARTWFVRWLSLEPDAALPIGTSPKLVALLGDARRRIAGEQLVLRAARGAGGDSGAITVEVRDPAALIAELRAGTARAPGNAQRIASAGDARQVEALDRHGNVLAVAPIEEPAMAIEPRTPVAPVGDHSSAWYGRWPAWAIGTGVAAATGGVALVLASRADRRLDELHRTSSEHDYAEAYAEEQRLSRAQWTARIAFGAAVATAVVGTVLYVRGREVRTAVVPTAGGAAIAWSARF